MESAIELNIPSKPSETKLMVLITVEDTGIGIAEEARKNLFQPFKQAQRMAGGTGLGLYSLSKRVEALGGLNGVSDRTDGKQGSVFWFTFPYRPDRAAATDANPEMVSEVSDSYPTASEPTAHKRILVIDDSLSILKVTSRLLMMNGHTVETAPNGSVGLKMLKEAFASQEFDMVLTDLQMPVMDGIEGTRRFREFEAGEMIIGIENSGCEPKRKKLLIVGMSANSDCQSKQEALDSGMDFFLTKPFSYQDLRPIILNTPR
jgi:CheY-like chemotaxis protein